MPRVSVILTSLNHDRFVAASIRSVLEQTFADFELFIIDDCSDDRSWDIIRQIDDPRIIAWRNPQRKRGVYGLNAVIRNNAKGDFVAIHHSDDLFFPDKLQRQVDFLDRNPDMGACFSHVDVIDEEGTPFRDSRHFYFDLFSQPNRRRHEWLRHFLLEGNCLCHPSAMLRRACFADIGFYDNRLGQVPDFDLWVRLCLKHDIHVLQEPLVRFRIRRHELNQSGNRLETRVRAHAELQQVLRHFLSLNIQDLQAMLPGVPVTESAQPYPAVPFHVALRLCNHGTASRMAFGLSTLYALMMDQVASRYIEHHFGFSYHDLIRLSGTLDLAQQERVENLEADIQRLKATLSWRVTKPLRFASHLWRTLSP